jgi:Co/Zn/Cd efflux system component
VRAAATPADHASDEHEHDEHGHGSHAGHSHGIKADADATRLKIALGLILGFVAVEVVVGILANSLALLSDAVDHSDSGRLLTISASRDDPAGD